jgi:MFS family permease
MAATALALLSPSQASEHAAYFPLLFVAFLFLGLGVGSAFLPLLTMATSEVPEADAGLASGIVNVSLWIAGALGLAVLGAVATSHTNALSAQGDSLSTALTGGYHLAFLISAAIVAAGMLAAAFALPSGEIASAEEGAEQREPDAEPEAQAA